MKVCSLRSPKAKLLLIVLAVGSTFFRVFRFDANDFIEHDEGTTKAAVPRQYRQDQNIDVNMILRKQIASGKYSTNSTNPTIQQEHERQQRLVHVAPGYFPHHPFNDPSLNYNVFENTTAVDITYIPNVTEPVRLHKGAWDVNGTGHPFRYDVTRLQKNPPSPWSSPWFDEGNMTAYCDASSPQAPVMEVIHVVPDPEAEAIAAGRPPIRLLCAVYSYKGGHKKLQTLRETWAPKCDGFFAASDFTETAVDAVQVGKEGGEAYNNMWNKIQGIWGYIYDNYYEDYDYFHIGGDDMWVIVENLRHYLNSDEIHLAQNGGHAGNGGVLVQEDGKILQFPLFLGEAVKIGQDVKELYNTGGPGYTLNKAALKLLITEILPAMATGRTSTEDVQIAHAFRNWAPNRVYPFPTNDKNLGRRYNSFGPDRHFYAKEPSWWRRGTRVFQTHGGPKHFSRQPAAFHYVTLEKMREYHARQYLCPAREAAKQKAEREAHEDLIQAEEAMKKAGKSSEGE